MKSLLSIVAVSLFVGSTVVAAELPAVPTDSIAERRELLFADDFSGSAPAPVWHKVVATFAVESGALKGTQTRDKDIPAANGKPMIRAHAAVHGLELPTKNSVVEARIRFEGATMIDVEFTDRKYTGAHYGHICRAQIRLTGVMLIDERDGNMRNDIYELKKDPTKKSEIARLTAGRSVNYPVKLEPGRWYALMVETVDDTMRVTIDGRPTAYLQSSGIAHATKSKIEFGVAGKDGWIDDVKVWNAEATR